MFFTLFAVFFFCVWFLFSRLDSFLIIQGAKSLVDGWSGEQSSSAGDFSCWWRDNIWSRAGWWAARMVGWVAGREQPCLEVGAAADSVWLPVAGARQWELPLSATATDRPHHTHHIGHGHCYYHYHAISSYMLLRLLKFMFARGYL